MAEHKRVATKPPKEKAAKAPIVRKRNDYINNKQLYGAVLTSKEAGIMTNELARMLQLLTLRYSKKGNFANYTYNEDMQAYAMMMLVRTWDAFNPEKSHNAFAFFTQCIKNSFIQYLNQEKRQRDIRDELYVDSGLTPSYNYQLEHGANSRPDKNAERQLNKAHDEEDFDQLQADAKDVSNATATEEELLTY